MKWNPLTISLKSKKTVTRIYKFRVFHFGITKKKDQLPEDEKKIESNAGTNSVHQNICACNEILKINDIL